MAMKTTIKTRSILDPSVEVDGSYSAQRLAEQHPDEPKYREWVQVLVVEEVPDAGT